MKGNYKQAVEALKANQEGEMPEALWHEKIGYIDLVWGEYNQSVPNKGWGFKKILEKHPEVAENLDEIIKNLPILIENERRITLDNGIYRALIMKNFKNEPKIWLLTAFEIKKGDG
jgi:hypothetical protein